MLVRAARAGAAADRLAEAIDEFVGCVGAGDAADPGLVELIASAHRAVSRLTAAEGLVVARLDASGRWRGSGARSLAGFLAASLGVLPATARASAKLGAALVGDLAAMGRAVLAGEVDVDHARLTQQAALRSEERREILARQIDVEVEVPVATGADGQGAAAEEGGDGACGSDGAGGADAAAWGVPGVERVAAPRTENVVVSMSGAEYLAGVAESLPASDYRRVLARWVAANDPNGLEAEYRAAEEREHLLVARTMGGWHVAGFLAPKTGQALMAALDAVHAPPSAGDRRTAGQRRAQDLAAVVERFLAKGLGGKKGSIRPQLGVHVAYDTLRRLFDACRPTVAATERNDGRDGRDDNDGRDGGDDNDGRDGRDDDGGRDGRDDNDGRNGRDDRDGRDGGDDGAGRDEGDGPDCLAGDLGGGRVVTGLDVDAMVGAEPAEWADGSGPIPHSLLAQLVCDASIARYVFGPKNEIINVGREKRFFNRAQRRALANRDTGCVFPSCTAPAAWCDAHHTPDFELGGTTDVDAGALLCPFHHRYYHAHSLTMWRDPTGTWRFHRPDGTEIVLR